MSQGAQERYLSPSEHNGRVPAGTLHPAILTAIFRAEYAMRETLLCPAVEVRHGKDLFTAADKLGSLQEKENELVAEKRFPGTRKLAFLVARTVPFTTARNEIGLLTTFTRGEEMTDDHLEALLVGLGYEYSWNEAEVETVLAKGGKPLTGTAVKGIRFGAESGVNIEETGAQPGVVGPWALNDLPVCVVTDYRPEYEDGEMPVVDFALTTRRSLLLPLTRVPHFIDRVAQELGHEKEPIFATIPHENTVLETTAVRLDTRTYMSGAVVATSKGSRVVSVSPTPRGNPWGLSLP